MTFTASELALLRASDAVIDHTPPDETPAQRNARQSRESRERRRKREGDAAYRARQNAYYRARRRAVAGGAP